MVQNTYLKSRWKSGPCSFCFRNSSRLEFHHVCYQPERGLYLCHNCHHKVTYMPWKLTEFEKQKLAAAGPRR